MMFLFVLFLLQLLVVKDGLAQTITFDSINTNTGCQKDPNDPQLFVLVGETFTITGVLDDNNVDSVTWPKNRIQLVDTVRNRTSQQEVENVVLCEINVQQDGCKGVQPGKCGYCQSQSGSKYTLVFNITATGDVEVYTVHTFRWIGTTNNVDSEPVYYQEISVYATPSIEYPASIAAEYSILNLPEGIWATSVPKSQLDVCLKDVSPTTNVTFYTADGNIVIPPDLCLPNDMSHWNSQSGQVYHLHYQDACGREDWRPIVVTEFLTNYNCELKTEENASANTLVINVTCYYDRQDGDLSTNKCNLKFQDTSSTRSMTLKATPQNSGDSLRNTSICLFVVDRSQPYSNWKRISFLNDIYFYSLEPKTKPAYIDPGPYILAFQVNKAQSIIVRSDDSVTFFCLVHKYNDSSARAVLSGPTGGRVGSITSNTELLQYTLNNLTCADAGQYTCTSVSGAQSTPGPYERQVQISVICPLQLAHPASNLNVFNRKLNDRHEDAIDVVGYPEPTGFELLYSNGTQKLKVDTSEYSVSYISKNMSYGTVNLTIVQVNKQGNISYTFQMKNRAGSQIDYLFYTNIAKSCNVTVVNRTEWGAKPPKSAFAKLTFAPNIVVLLQTKSASCGSLETCSATLKAVQVNQQKTKADIPANFLVGGDARIYVSRDWGTVGDHTNKVNDISIAISFIGDYTTNQPSEIMQTAVKNFLTCGVEQRYLSQDFKVYGQRQFMNTDAGTGLYQALKMWSTWNSLYFYGDADCVQQGQGVCREKMSDCNGAYYNRWCQANSSCCIATPECHSNNGTCINPRRDPCWGTTLQNKCPFDFICCVGPP